MNAAIFVIPEATEIVWKHFEEESILFDKRSGETHLLTALAVETLMAIQKRPMDVCQLISEIANTFDLQPSDVPENQINELLFRFEDMGLIEQRAQ
jgi:PqqD family protein of HPr-rel-A system